MNLPKIRRDLLVQDLNDEVLVYDTDSNNSYCLNSTARTVFNACDGKTTISDLKQHLPEDVIYLSLDELSKNNLIQSGYVSPFAGMNRRDVIKKVGLATMVALPVISGLVAPKAAHATSNRRTIANCDTCDPANNQCISGRCVQNGVGQGFICNGGTSTNGAFPRGTVYGSADAASCTSTGSEVCCSGNGSSGFTPIDATGGDCTCSQ